MIDLIKKTVLAGIGATVVTKEKIEAAMQDWVKQGKVSTEDARQFANRLAEEGRKEWEITSKDLSERIRDLLAKADYARRTEVAALEARVKALEEKLEALTRVSTE
jgi:polyhydroxyalkanoate synthesis regulator phasin